MTIDSQEQNQRTMKAIVLCVLVAVVYTQVFLNKKKPVAAPAQQQSSVVATAPAVGGSVTAPTSQVSVGVPQVINAPVLTKHPSNAEIGAAQITSIASDEYTIKISHLGARVLNFQLNKFKHHLGETAALDMVDNPEGAVLPLAAYFGQESDEYIMYSLALINGEPNKNLSNPQSFQLTPSSTLTLDFVGKLPSGATVTKRLKINQGSYLFNVELITDKPLQGGATTWLEWSHYFPKSEENPRLKLTHITYLDGANKIKQVPLAELPEGMRDFGTSMWASLGDIYFMSTMIPTVGGRNTMLGREGEVFLSRVAGTPSGGNFKVYVGPKELSALQTVGDSLERSVDLGWFAFLAQPLLTLLHMLYVVLNNYGLAIIALTLLVKAALLPISKAGFQSMKKMQDLQPEMKALKERISDSTQLNQEVLKLYQKKGVNPMGGCFPLVIQIPVFLGLYQALLNSFELRHAPFALWIKDLSAPEHLNIFGLPIPVMVLLMSATMVIQQWTTPTPTMDPVQKRMMTFMPVIFAVMFIIFPMPAGLVLYWLVSNIISIVQQMYMRKVGNGTSVYTATAITSAALFAVGYILTLV